MNKAKGSKIKKLGIWGEIGLYSIVDIALLIAIIFVYNLTTNLPALLLFLLFLALGVIHAFHKRFEKSNFFLSQKGKVNMFIKSCLPYVLQTVFFVQCSLLVAWILLNL